MKWKLWISAGVVVPQKTAAVGAPKASRDDIAVVTRPAGVANYDPPFTPPFMRRNEVLVRLSSE